MVETVIVRVAQGSLKGQKVKTEVGATYYSFHAIPYAKPPVGPLRFKVSLIILVTKATYRCISVLLCNCEQQMKPVTKLKKKKPHVEFV